jgi:hypothetical protein
VSCLPVDPLCLAGQAVGAAASAGVNAAGNAIAQGWADEVRKASSWLLENSIGWWLNIASVDLAGSPVGTLQTYTLPLVLIVAVFGCVLAGVRMVLTRKPDPLIGVGHGLGALVIWTTLGTALATAALRGGDAFSLWVLNAAASGRAADKLVSLAGFDNIDSAVAVIFLGSCMFVAGLVQAGLMVFREVSIVVLVSVIPLAASGQFSAGTRKWLPKVLGWLAALLVYKPAAALVYACALTMWGDAKGFRASLGGIVLLVLATFTLPVLLKLFVWTAESVDARGGGGLGTAASVAASGAQVSAAMRRGGGHDSAARDVSSSLGPVTPTASHGPPGPPGATPTPAAAAPAAPATAAAAPTATAGTAAAATATGPAAPVVLVAAGATSAAKSAATSAMDAATAATAGTSTTTSRGKA